MTESDRSTAELSVTDSPIRTRPFPPWPAFDDDVVDAVRRVLESGRVNYWTGEEGRAFEEEFARSVQTDHAVAVMNGTVALELALRAVGVGPGDEVITSPRTFLASASAAVVLGAKPVFADVDPDSQNITAETVERVVTARTKAIVPVHLAGWPCDMDPLLELARAHDLRVVEDCAQAHGASYRGRPVGSMGDVAAYSFCQDKIITTGGEGGMVVTNNPEIWEKVWAFKDHGKNFDAVFNREHPPGFRWLHESFGTNGRMTEMQAAIGRILLRRLPEFVERRRSFARTLNDAFETVPALRVTRPPKEASHSYYKYYVFVRPTQLKPGWDRDRIMVEVMEEGVPCFSGSCSEIYLEKAFESDGMRPEERLETAKQLGESSLMFFVHPTLSDEDIEDTADAVMKIMSRASACG